MALRPWSPELEFSEHVTRQAAVSTGPSLELCTFPSTLGSSVAAAALEQLFVAEQSLQSDYFKCNEEARIFLKDIAIAVKKLEDMRKATIDLLEIESMEFSRLYFQLETFPDNVSTELEECVRDARRLNLSEINELQTKITKINNEIQFVKKRIFDLKEVNKALGGKQEDLARQHEKTVLTLNRTLGVKASTTMCINETYSKIDSKNEEIKVQTKYLQDIEEQIERERAEYLKIKQKLGEEIDKYKKLCELKRQETYQKKKELDKLRLTEAKLKESVTTNTVVLSDHNLEIAQVHESIRHWEKEIEEIEKSCRTLEDKIQFFKTNKDKLEEAYMIEKNELLQKIKRLADNLQKTQLENKELQEKLQTLSRQYKIVLQEENKTFLQKKKIHDEYRKQLQFIAQKENFLSQRKLDIKNMEEGLVTLNELHRATKEVYRKQIRILNDNLERERQRCIIIQWKTACLRKIHARWLLQIKTDSQEIMEEIQVAESRRTQLLQETNSREKEIAECLEQTQKITLELNQEKEQFIIREKVFIQELSRCEQKFVKESESMKIQEEELVECLPLLQMAEKDYQSTSRKSEELENILTAQTQNQSLLNDQISQLTRDFSRYSDNVDKLKQELKQLRHQECHNIKSHFEILRNLEREIYGEDLKVEALLLENKRLKAYIAHLRSNTEEYTQGEETLTHSLGDLSWQVIAHQTQYLELWATFQTTIKEFVHDCEETLQEMKNLIDKLYERDEKIENISTWLQGSLKELHFLTDTLDLPKKNKQSRFKKVRLPLVVCTMKNINKEKVTK